jgi:hypothetical protein
LPPLQYGETGHCSGFEGQWNYPQGSGTRPARPSNEVLSQLQFRRAIFAQPSPLLHTVTVSGFCTALGWVIGHISPDPHNGRILLANLLQSSRSTFSWGGFPSFFVFKAGMLDTQILAPGGWPTVSGRFFTPCRRPGMFASSYT